MSYFSTLLYLMAGGLFGMLAIIPYRVIGFRYHRFITILSLIGWTLVFFLVSPDQPGSWWFFGLSLGLIGTGTMYVGALNTESPGARRLSYWLTFVLTMGFLVALAVWPPHMDVVDYQVGPLILLAHFILSAAILGGIIDSMICGHWYLVNHQMGLGPIRKISIGLAVVLVAKLFLSLGQLGWYWFSHRALFDLITSNFPVFFWVRFAVGIGGGLLFTWMSWEALKHNNPQASTGILYACIVWIILGEFSAFYLMTSTGVPI